MVLIYQSPNAHVRISGILLRNAMAAVAVKKIYCTCKKNIYRGIIFFSSKFQFYYISKIRNFKVGGFFLKPTY
jgi:hypothetical protein